MLEKLADLLEIMLAIVKAKGWNREQLEQIRLDKSSKCDGFEKRLQMKEVSHWGVR